MKWLCVIFTSLALISFEKTRTTEEITDFKFLTFWVSDFNYTEGFTDKLPQAGIFLQSASFNLKK